MQTRKLVIACSIFSLLPGIAGIGNCRAGDPDKTPLDEYVAKPDPTYSWKLVRTIPGNGQTTFVVDMKSQTWRSSPEVDRPLWQHWVTIVKPDEVKYDTAFLLIAGVMATIQRWRRFVRVNSRGPSWMTSTG